MGSGGYYVSLCPVSCQHWQLRSFRTYTERISTKYHNNNNNNNNNIITDLYRAFRSEDTEALDAAQED